MVGENNNSVKFRDSVNNNAIDKNTDDKKQQTLLVVDKPIHQIRDSLFTSSSGFHNYRGFLNLALILLGLSTGRVALENIIKYGILVDPLQMLNFFFVSKLLLPIIFTTLSLVSFIGLAYFAEKKLSQGELTEDEGLRLQIFNCVLILLFPILLVYLYDIHAVNLSIVCMGYSILFLKLVSYHMVNMWCRTGLITRRQTNNVNSNHNGNHVNTQQDLVQYPNNLNLSDICYFIAAPTLCYELNFPRTKRIRKGFLFKRLIEMIFLLHLNLALIQQWMVPTINNSLKPLQEMDYSRMLERLLKLAIPNHLIWLIWFYWYFHSTLNFISEILRFGDRQFYLDWWNAESVEYFWKNWNIPVHDWCVRHLFKPLLRRGYKKLEVTIIVFLFSAFFHEYIISVPLKMVGYWAFMGMCCQVPFALFVRKYLRGSFANSAVWVSLIIGQPLCILACYHDYYVIHHAVY